MSVGVMMYDNKTDQLISNYSFPVSTEEFFIKYWQTAIDELGIKRIQNGIELRESELAEALNGLDKLENWAKSNLTGENLDYMVTRIELMQSELPVAFQRKDIYLWIG